MEETLTSPSLPRFQAVQLTQTVNIMTFLEHEGIPSAQARKWARRFEQIAGTMELGPGHRAALYRNSENGELCAFGYDLGPRIRMTEIAVGNDIIVTKLEPIPYITQGRIISLELNKNFFQEAERRGLSKQLLDTVKQAFKYKYRLDETFSKASSVTVFYTYQRSYDSFYRTNQEFQAARLVANGKDYVVIGLKDGSGRLRFFDKSGREIGPTYLRYPLHFQFISSGFSYGRYHPILHRYRPHLGVDFVARYGTPVVSIGDGEVESAQWEGELGRCVRIKHEDGFETLYGHLARFGEGIKPGVRVRAGQVIGRVGSSGLSTGPHLHFSVIKDGRYLDPMAVRLSEPEYVPHSLWKQFHELRRICLEHLTRVTKPGQEIMFTSTSGSQEESLRPILTIAQSKLEARTSQASLSDGFRNQKVDGFALDSTYVPVEVEPINENRATLAWTGTSRQ